MRDGLRCSFCGTSQLEVCALVAGPAVLICDACADLCQDILTEDTDDPDAGHPSIGSLPLLDFLRTYADGRSVDALTIGELFTLWRKKRNECLRAKNERLRATQTAEHPEPRSG